MLSFFNKNKNAKINKTGEDSTISSQELLNEQEENTVEAEVETTLSLHPTWTISTEQQYVYRYLSNELQPLKPNQISIAGVEVNKDNDNLVVTAFIRNSLAKPIKMESTTLLLIGTNNEKLAKKEFDLSVLGEIPAKSNRPWHFVFEKTSLFINNFPDKGWKLAFELKSKTTHELDLEESWEKSLAEEEKLKLKEMVEKLEPPKSGEINFLGLQIKQVDNNDLHVTVLIRNGNDKGIKLEQIPLQIEDANGEIIAKGGFKLDNFQVNPNTSKPWTFIFPSTLVTKENPDLSKWQAYPVQK
ncbi:accessory Sec system S-layer assembly protein [Cytobacillus sp. S13-E01]|uniref:accessory Sec system S-layer assembly protein n=1 Tax=Cytobacillus sp. S13-E01 TaxID=3031326 RepID=UPI0023D7BA3C|nr:accessory Sec system S-layer assembly protein [Cytobacillus sp. S13-E01]MDF0726055.1 accessory Sec system S-layer assembly protein [Cytobacillus sp. S13-E01]